IIRAFGPDSRNVAAFRRDGELLFGSAAWEMNEGLLAVRRRRDLADEIAVLLGCIAQLDSSSVDGRRPQPGEDDRRSILVHGRDDARREALAEFLGRLGLRASFSRGVPASGREAEYVVILIDDGRGTGDEGTGPGTSRSSV